MLRDALAARGVLDERVSAELDAGQRYWALERRICAALGRGTVPDAGDVAACHEAKSFDYRALHCVLHRLLRAPYDDQLLAFLRLDELLVDVGDDLTDYEDDVCANSFNIYRRVPLHKRHVARRSMSLTFHAGAISRCTARRRRSCSLRRTCRGWKRRTRLR